MKSLMKNLFPYRLRSLFGGILAYIAYFVAIVACRICPEDADEKELREATAEAKD